MIKMLDSRSSKSFRKREPPGQIFDQNLTIFRIHFCCEYRNLIVRSLSRPGTYIPD
jgi:hypothetical protein